MTAPLHPVDLPLSLQIALDLLAPPLSRGSGPTLILGGSERLRATARLWLDSPSCPGEEERFGRVLWLAEANHTIGAEPTNPLETIRLAPDALVAIVLPGSLATLRARLRARPSSTPPAKAVERHLRARGLAITARWRIGAPSTVLWAALALAATRADRPDLADRLAVLHRHSLAPRAGRGPAERLALLASGGRR